MNRTIRTVSAALIATGLATGAHATVFELNGMVQTCNALACSAAGISIGDNIAGFIEVDDAVSGPDSTFTQADVTGYEVAVGDLVTSGTGLDLGDSSLTTGPDGEIVSGTALLLTSVDTGLGIANIELTLDAALGTWQAATTFLGLGVISTGTLAFSLVADSDADGDGVADTLDNCTLVSNPDQLDSNGDGFGNRCDADLNNDLMVNLIDLIQFKAVFATADADANLDGIGVVNLADLVLFKNLFGAPPGPSALAP